MQQGGGCPFQNFWLAQLPEDGIDIGPTLAFCPKDTLWYSCARTSPSFQGCCAEGNPCHLGVLNCTNPAPACAGPCRGANTLTFSATSVMSTTTLPSAATTAITATTATITTTPHAAAGSSLPIAPIVAGVVVGIVVLVVIGVGIAFYMRKKRNAKKAEKEERENRVVADQGERNVEGGWVYTGSQQVGHVAGKNCKLLFKYFTSARSSVPSKGS
jgi:hypothetical protein